MKARPRSKTNEDDTKKGMVKEEGEGETKKNILDRIVVTISCVSLYLADATRRM